MEEAIESVLCQRFEDWELLIVDDGSTDVSREIAERYASIDPSRISVFAHPDLTNHGLSSTLNLGIAQARAQFIAFLDADDIWLPDRLAHDVDCSERIPQLARCFLTHFTGGMISIDRLGLIATTRLQTVCGPRERSFGARSSETNVACHVRLQ